MAEPEEHPGTAARKPAPSGRAAPSGADRGRVIALLRQARAPIAGGDGSLAALRRRVRELEQENERLRHGPHGGPA